MRWCLCEGLAEKVLSVCIQNFKESNSRADKANAPTSVNSYERLKYVVMLEHGLLLS